MPYWDNPSRTRGLFLAAVLVALCGLIIRWDEPTPVLKQESAGTSAKRWSLGRAVEAPVESGDLASNILFEGETTPPSEELRDAVASLSAVSMLQTGAGGMAGAAGFYGTSGGRLARASNDNSGRPTARQAAQALQSGKTAPASSRKVTAKTTTDGRQSVASANAASGQGSSLSSSRSDVTRKGARYDTDKFFARQAPIRTESTRTSSGGKTNRAGASLSGAPVKRPLARRPPAAHPLPGRLRPALLSRLLGPGPLKAPIGVPAPKSNPWKQEIPQSTPDGRKISPTPLGVTAAESLAPPQMCRRSALHWHADEEGDWRHQGTSWGRWDGRAWSWFERSAGRWWTWPQPEHDPLVRHQEHWWLKNRGLWFLLHDSEPWGYRYLPQWGREGFEHASGAQMIYSADGSRVGIVVPGSGAILYDAYSGTELGRWREEDLPRRRATAPNRLPAF